MWEEIFDNIINESKKNRVIDPRDYRGEDGNLYCWKCHKAKEMVLNFPDGVFETRTVYPICDCEKAEIDRQDKARAEQQRREKLERSKAQAFKDPTFRAMTFAADDGSNAEIMKKARAYVRHWPEMRDKNNGLLFWGTVGTGKTFTAACIANELVERGVSVIMTSFPRIINTLQGKWEDRQELLDELNDHDLLVIDDFSVERKTEYAQEIIYEVIDSRYKIGYPLIVTTNLTAQELKNPVDVSKKRIYSRLIDMCHPVEIAGTDRRRKNIIRNFADMEAILNEDEPEQEGDVKGA